MEVSQNWLNFSLAWHVFKLAYEKSYTKARQDGVMVHFIWHIFTNVQDKPSTPKWPCYTHPFLMINFCPVCVSVYMKSNSKSFIKFCLLRFSDYKSHQHIWMCMIHWLKFHKIMECSSSEALRIEFHLINQFCCNCVV